MITQLNKRNLCPFEHQAAEGYLKHLILLQCKQESEVMEIEVN